MVTWQIRLKQAEKFSGWKDLLLAGGAIEGAFYLAHMSVELIIKMAIARNNSGWHPTEGWSHKLIRLISDKRTQFVFVEMANDQNSNVHKSFLSVSAANRAWDMQYRYEGTKLNDDEMRESIGAYTEIFKWTKENYAL